MKEYKFDKQTLMGGWFMPKNSRDITKIYENLN